MLKRQLERYGKWLAAIAALIVVSLAISAYIESKQRLTPPWADRYTIKAELESTNGVNPGLGAPVQVAGVEVGQISDVKLVNGRAIVSMSIKPKKLPHIYTDAHATLVPKTPLKDMQIQLQPGTPSAPVAKENWTIPVAHTAPPIDSDELTGALDADTRQFFQVLVSGLGRGTAGRGRDLNALFKQLGPTAQEARELGDALVGRRREIRRLVHNLALLTQAAGSKDTQIAQVVSSANATLAALGGQEAQLREATRKLPGTLAAARATLGHTTAFADELGPTLDRLQPAVRELPPALRALGPLAKEATPIVRTRLRPLVKSLQPVAKDLGPATRDLSAVTPSLATSFQVLNYVANELGYNPQGSNEGFLYWLAWFAHNGNSMLGSQDANGVAWRGLVLVACSTVSQNPSLGPLIDALVGSTALCK